MVLQEDCSVPYARKRAQVTSARGTSPKVTGIVRIHSYIYITHFNTLISGYYNKSATSSREEEKTPISPVVNSVMERLLGTVLVMCCSCGRWLALMEII